MMSHAVNKKAFSNGSKSVEDEKKSFLNHFNLSKKSGDDISIWCLDKWQIFRQGSEFSRHLVS